MLAASSVMYFRLLALLGIFNRQLLHGLGLPFLLAAAALLGGWLWMRILDRGGTKAEQALQPKNPLELGAAFLFAGLFVGMLFITHLARDERRSIVGVNFLADA